MKIIISGASGLIGSEVYKKLIKAHVVYKLTRQEPTSKHDIHWDPKYNALNTASIEGCDAIIHLAGESIAGYWTKSKKANIKGSRVNSTQLLVNSILLTKKKPHTFICASAVGYYGDAGDKILNESSNKGRGFLASVCSEWEKATDALKQLGIRVVNLRFGVVLSEKSGALKSMLPAFRLGLGGKIGTGKQYLSWISLNDATRAIIYCLENQEISGAVNVTSPNPISNAEFTKALASCLKRPAFFNIPETLIKFTLGEMGKELLLSSTRAIPEKLIKSGFILNEPEINKALLAIFTNKSDILDNLH